MALALQSWTFIQQYATSWLHGKTKTSSMALNLGVLSAANINAAGGQKASISYSSNLPVAKVPANHSFQSSIPPKLTRT